MVTSRTYFRRLGAIMHISAYKALPVDRSLSFPYRTVLHLFQISLETVMVKFFNRSDGKEVACNFIKTFSGSNFSSLFIILVTFSRFFLYRNSKVGRSVTEKSGINASSAM